MNREIPELRESMKTPDRSIEELPPYLREVLRRMAQGMATKQIAADLNISVSTVNVYRERVYSKLGVNGLAQATVVAVRGRLI